MPRPFESAVCCRFDVAGSRGQLPALLGHRLDWLVRFAFGISEARRCQVKRLEIRFFKHNNFERLILRFQPKIPFAPQSRLTEAATDGGNFD